MTLTLRDAFLDQAARTPDAHAVVHGGTVWTYRELELRAGRMARTLAERGAGPGTLVAVRLPRGPEPVAALLAVVLTGAGYVPLADDDPPDRCRHILDDCAAALLLAEHPSRDGRTLTPDEALAPARPFDAAPVRAGDPAYVIYTSGSSGRPKGVLVEQGALGAYLAQARARYDGLSGRTVLHSSLSFDMAVTSLWGPLVSGGAIHVLDLKAIASGTQPPPAASARPSFLKVTPSHLPLLGLLPDSCLPTGQLVIGGEALTGSALGPWRAAHPGVTVVNEYGPTEATVGCCAYTVRPGDAVDPGAVPIGRPFAGTRLYVLDADGEPVAVGGVGELHIAGDQLARGYLGRPRLTEERFVPDPFAADGSRMYRTGDLVRERPDGDLEYLGRADGQVRVSGYRIEPGEIEAVLRGHAGVRDCAVVAVGEADARRLVAYVVPDPDSPPGTAAPARHAAEALPPYMVPATFVTVPELPLTPNGKLDRDALPGPPAGDAGPGDRTPAETLLCELLARALGIPEIDADADFLTSGGTSITALKLVAGARRVGIRLELTTVLRERTVRRILAAQPDAASPLVEGVPE
ncbi:non-ribosomal peptide synthetase [Streptomyces mobaraensis]|uniref:Non-ribosomal peptide synthetase n=1 Tax=Streptomyces mobaraensis TaxID=35621 RepID=A0A5N5VYT0_STRMB|nr:non-ribosomal peptide synthetase [Streptomyces mobaraensis]KAB7833956.1 non-ribosomal peptide synthetase [Streptomyces mobaraensis]